MEHAQRELENSGSDKWWKYIVLILILMEHAQRVRVKDNNVEIIEVLILILMEHAQRAGKWNLKSSRALS